MTSGRLLKKALGIAKDRRGGLPQNTTSAVCKRSGTGLLARLSPFQQPAIRPSRVRWLLLALMFLVSTVTYLDRVNVSIATRYIMSDYRLSDVEMGKVFSAFIFGYGIFQVPWGWLGDRLGPRAVLTWAIFVWSIFTGLTAVAGDLFSPAIAPVWALILVRFGMGMGEAAAWPNFNRAIANWMAQGERAFASSIPLAGGGIGAAFTPPLIAWLMVSYGWKESFFTCAALGLAVAVVWYIFARDRPEQHPGVNESELRIIRGEPLSAPAARAATPWKIILTERNVYLLFCSAACQGYLVYIFMTWFYTYLIEARHLTPMTGSLYTTGPFIAIAVMTPLGGVLSDWAARRFGLTVGRRLIAMGGMILSASALLIGASASNINLAIVGLSLGGGAIYFALSASWATTIDIAKEHAGTVSGFMNWGGNMGGMISPILTPIVARRFGWTPALQLAAAIMFAGSMLWLFIQPQRRLGQHAKHYDARYASSAES